MAENENKPICTCNLMLSASLCPLHGFTSACSVHVNGGRAYQDEELAERSALAEKSGG